VLASLKGQAVSGTFVLTALTGPVSHFTIRIPAAMATKVKVRPSGGSLPANGRVTITVTVISYVALNTYLTVDPGNITVTVLLSIKV
jgi:hypothetical protein